MYARRCEAEPEVPSRMFTAPFPPVRRGLPAGLLRSAVVASEHVDRPTARLGYAAEDLEAFLRAGECRLAELAAAIVVAEARRDDARTESAGGPALRRQIAEQWLDAYARSESSAGVGA